MNNAGIALEQIRTLHEEMVSLDSSNTSILKETRNVELFMNKAARDTNGYRKRLTEVYEILEARKIDYAIANGLDNAGLTKDLIEDLMFARSKPIDKAFEHLRELQQEIVDIKIAKRDLLAGTVQLERQLKNASEKISTYEDSLSSLMTFLGKKGLLDVELIQAFNGSKTNNDAVNAIMGLQKKK